MLERVADRRRRERDVAERKLNEREPRLRVPPDVVRLEENLLGDLQIALSQLDPTQLAERPTELAAKERAELVARNAQLLLGRTKRSSQAQNFRAMHATAPMQTPKAVLRTPALHYGRPLVG